MKPYMRAEYGVIVEHKGDPVGVAVLIPNLYEITGDVGPDPSPLGWAKLGWRTAFHRFSTGRIILLGVQSKLKNSVGGAVIAMSMVKQLIDELSNYKGHVEWIEAGWVLEDNAALVRLLEQFGFSITRTFRILQKDIGTPKEAN